MDTSESTEDVDRLLAKARAALEEFEDSVDRRRLMQRLRSSSPAHPVLLFRFLFGVLFVLCVATAVTLMAVATFNAEFARTLAKFEGVIATPLPEEIPVLPALFGLLALMMALAWATATLAALSLGREAQLLPWERKEHQNIVNEITRLTTQRAVMGRIRGTPAGARPRIATPVPLGPRVVRSSSSRAASPVQASGGGPYGGFTRSTPSGSPTYTNSTSASPSPPTGTPGFSARRGSLGSRLAAAAPPTTAPRPPAAPPPLEITDDDLEELSADDDTASAGGVRLGGPAPATRREDDDEHTVPSPPGALSDAAYRDLLDDSRPPPGPGGGAAGQRAPAANVTPGGILGRARAGVVGLRSTPFGSAGRVRPPGLVTTPAKAKTPVTAPLATNPPTGKPRPRLVSRPNPIDRATAPLAGSRSATAVAPTPSAPKKPVLPTMPPPLATSPDVPIEVVVVMEEEDELPTATGGDPARRRPPAWGPIHEDWLKDAIDKADALLRSFPQQAYLSYSQEPHLPFTLVIARAAPAAAVRAMASFVDFLASIATPPRARIELVGVAHLDRSFHKNVEAALEPHFGGNVDIEANPGRVDIRFTDPDPQWGSHPVLPLA